jgi:hypothetical protein
MSFGARHDFLEARWNMSNFQKLIGLGATIAKRLQTAMDGRIKHSQELEEFTAAFSPVIIEEWTRMVYAFHCDPKNNKDPYQTHLQGKHSTIIPLILLEADDLCRVHTCTHYREERAAALRLDPQGSWQNRLKELRKSDVRPARENESDTEESPRVPGKDRAVRRESQRTISWIWKMAAYSGDGQDGQNDSESGGNEGEHLATQQLLIAILILVRPPPSFTD